MEFANRLQNVEILAFRARFESPGLVLPCDGTGDGRRRGEPRSGFMACKMAGLAMHAPVVVSGNRQAR